MKAQIKINAYVTRGFETWVWGDYNSDATDTLFDIEKKDPIAIGRVACVADGYGNEPLYCNMEDLINISNDECGREAPPPIGLCPKWLRDGQRGQEILDAMLRYNNARKRIPEEWIEEFKKINGDRRP